MCAFGKVREPKDLKESDVLSTRDLYVLAYI